MSLLHGETNGSEIHQELCEVFWLAADMTAIL